ncbi:hypothetical protein GCM10023350_30110 [Nocardioides endophyticus]|uniref:Uncharacterized protein n=1 Tax=Nocardioides endophyticus TaxID=1353775 RepID=A0ABP8Z112_9ACTN
MHQVQPRSRLLLDGSLQPLQPLQPHGMTLKPEQAGQHGAQAEGDHIWSAAAAEWASIRRVAAGTR